MKIAYTNKEKFIADLNEQRKRLGIDVYTASKVGNVSWSTIYFFLKGDRDTNFQVVRKNCKAIGCRLIVGGYTSLKDIRYLIYDRFCDTNLTITEAAKGIGWNPTNLRKVVLDGHDCLFSNFVRICEFFNIPIEYEMLTKEQYIIPDWDEEV